MRAARTCSQYGNERPVASLNRPCAAARVERVSARRKIATTSRSERNELLDFFFFASPHGLTFTWWGCLGLCQGHKPTELAHSFHSVLASLMALSPVFRFINSPDNSPYSHSVLPVLFLPYWSFQLYISFLKSPEMVSETRCVCRALRPVSGEEGLLEACWGQYISLARISCVRLVCFTKYEVC